MYQALYRKYRPNVFSDVIGQDHITKTLMNEVRTGRHSHAYLFTGSRGTGKTTCAKIFAKAVNCEHPVNGDPCNECEICRGIDNGSILDVVEIDAASNNGVDNIRDIRDEVNFTPVNGTYRVYIIDEVHMLSSGAFNALLKTLEEPPEHVKFILATTEVHKLPATILSRCQRFDFRRISPEDIARRVSYVAEKENLELTPEAAGLIARLADGALRDALSILDQCMGRGRLIDENAVNEVVGLTGRQHLFQLADSILRRDSASALDQINDLYNRSCDMERLCSELIHHFRNLMVCRAVHDPQNLIVCSQEELQEYIRMAAPCSMEELLNILNTLGDSLAYIRKGLNRRVEMEMAVIRLCSGPAVLSAPSAGRPAAVPAAPASPAASAAAPAVSAAVPAASAASAAKPRDTGIAMLNFSVNDGEPKAEEPKAEEAKAEEAKAEENLPWDAAEEPSAPSASPAQPAPAAPSAPAAVPAPSVPKPTAEKTQPVPEEHISLQDALDDGPIPTNIWNAVIREIVSHDKPLIGILNSAKAAKRGDLLLLQTDNVLLKRFITMEAHRTAIYNATFVVLGEYLNPRIVGEEDIVSVAFDAKPKEPNPSEPQEPKEAKPQQPKPAAEEFRPAAPEEPIPAPLEEAPAAAAAEPAEEPGTPEDPQNAAEPTMPDPLHSFIDNVRQLGIPFTLED